FALDYVARKPIDFTENLNYIPNAPPPEGVKLRWNFGDGSPNVLEYSPKHTYAAPGIYLVRVDTYDTSQGWILFDYAHIHVVSTVPGNAPVAHITAGSTTAVINTDISFDATGSHAQDGSALTYTWDFNDGTRQTGAHASHQWVQPGRTLVALIVTDAHGAKSA